MGVTKRVPSQTDRTGYEQGRRPGPANEGRRQSSGCSVLWGLYTRAFVVLAVLGASVCGSPEFDVSRFDGNSVLENDAGPMALEISGAGTSNRTGSIVGAVGGRKQPFLDSSVEKGRLTFRVAREFDDGRVVGSTTVAWFEWDQFRGEATREDRDGKRTWTGRPMEVVADTDDGGWVERDPVALFNGSNLTGWRTEAPGRLGEWTVENGVLRSAGEAEALISDRRFWNFQLQVKYRVPEGGNGGVALRGRYEVQILDDYGHEATIHGNGAIYSRIAPSSLASKPPSEWQTFDIRLIGRVVSIELNGVQIIDRQVIQGLTDMAIAGNESEPGPIVLQRNHGPIEFRRIVAIPPVRPGERGS